MRRLPLCAPLLALLVGSLAASTVSAQGTSPEERGFLVKADANATGKEISAQRNLWVMEVRFKPMRLVNVELTDPATGTKSKELVWYVVYEIVNRPLARRADDRNVTPANEVDPPPGPSQFVPEFTLVTDDNGRVRVHNDEILPEAVAQIERREKQKYWNCIEAIGDVPAQTDYDAEKEQVIRGVATFRGIDPEVDYFTLIGTGFSNGFRVTTGPDGEPLVWRKTCIQKYWRPGDQFAQNEGEFRFRGEPTWIYRPDDVTDPLEGIVAPKDDDAETPEE